MHIVLSVCLVSNDMTQMFLLSSINLSLLLYLLVIQRGFIFDQILRSRASLSVNHMARMFSDSDGF